MANEIQSSFIPKQSLVRKAEFHREPIGLVMMVALFLLVISAALLAAAWSYQYYLAGTINNPCPNKAERTTTAGCGLLASLKIERDKLDYESMSNLQRADAKNKLATQILTNHISMVPAFTLLNQAALRTVQFKHFQYDATGITIDGVAASYEDVAVQSQVIDGDAYSKLIKNPIFSDLNLDQKGNISFKLSFIVDPSLTSYRNHLPASVINATSTQ